MCYFSVPVALPTARHFLRKKMQLHLRDLTGLVSPRSERGTFSFGFVVRLKTTDYLESDRCTNLIDRVPPGSQGGDSPENALTFPTAVRTKLDKIAR